jgi:hypothetical protein
VRAITTADKAIFLFYQHDGMSNTDYFEQFNAMVESAQSYGSSLGVSEGLRNLELANSGHTITNATAAQKQAAITAAKEKYLATVMLDGANFKRFSSLRESLDKDYAKGVDTYPVNRNAVLRLMNTWDDSVKSRARKPDPKKEKEDADHLFAQDEERSIKCYKCGGPHLKRDCPKLKKEEEDKPAEEQLHAMTDFEDDDGSVGSDSSPGVVLDAIDDDEGYFFFAQVEEVLAQPEGDKSLNKNWLLLDSQSSTDMFCNSDYLTDICDAPTPTIIRCNAGKSLCTKKGMFKTGLFGSIPVKYYPKGICNLISLKTMGKLFRVTYDSDEGGCFKVFMPRGIAKFKQCKKGLHYLDLSKLPDKLKEDVCCVTTIQKNFEGFTRREVEDAIRARRLQGMLGGPTDAVYEGMVRDKLIDNCPVTPSDIKNAHTILLTSQDSEGAQ